jgi:hypothetical protein
MTSETKHPVQSDFEKSSVNQLDPLDQPAAIHADLEDIDSGYWRSYRFLGTVLAIILLANSLFIGYVMPVSTLRHHGGKNKDLICPYCRSTFFQLSMQTLVRLRPSYLHD